MTRRGFLISAAASAACGRKRGAGFPGYAFVANEEGQAVAVVDLTAFAVARHIRLEASPTRVISHPLHEAVYALTPRNGTVHEIRLDTLTAGRRARLPGPALDLRFGPAANVLWALCADSRQLVRLPLDNFRPDARIALPAVPAEFEISPDGAWAVVSLPDRRIAALVNLAQRRVERQIPTGAQSGFLRFRDDSRLLLAANPADRVLSAFEIPSGRLLTHLPLAVSPKHCCFKGDGGQLFLTGDGMDAVVTVYTYRTEVGATTLAGRAPGYVAASTAPDYLFVANPASGDVTILNIQTQRVMAAVAVGREPGHITITPDNQYALVLNRVSGDMAVIRLASVIANRARSAPLFTMIPVGSRPVSAVVRAV